MQQLSIGAVARLTGVPAHTLRKWESRHGIAAASRTDTGRRVYTDEHVQKIRLVKELSGQGHALDHLAGLDLQGLQALATEHGRARDVHAVRRIALIGHSVSGLLVNQRTVGVRIREGFDVWLEQALNDVRSPASLECDFIVAEVDTLLPELAEKICRWHDPEVALLLVCRYASRSALNRVHRDGIPTLADMPDDAALLARIEWVEEAEPPAPPLRFDRAELSRIAQINPGIECECPKHIAELLMDISAFEQYSAACKDTDPAERALHASLVHISSQARRLFEDALIAVAAADDIELRRADANT